MTKIAKSFAVPVELILAHNSFLTDPNKIVVDQLIFIPNIDDIPIHEFDFTSLSADDLVRRARSAINKGIRYRLGEGGTTPGLNLPTSNKLCDCSGFVCWILGISRKTTIPFYSRFGGWIYTDSMVADINNQAGIFEKINIPEMGCIVVYGAGHEIGHCGLVSKVTGGQMTKVIHCSKGNDNKYRDSIQETSPDIFNRADTVWGRFSG